MKNYAFASVLLTIAAGVSLGACGNGNQAGPKVIDGKGEPEELATARSLAFRDAVKAPPAGWSGPVFKLSHDYPKEKPTCDSPWLRRNVDFSGKSSTWNADWQGYVQDIVNYVKEGQEPNLPDDPGWRIQVSGQTRWFNVPWMAYDGERGREFVHGLTNELSTAETAFIGRGSGKHILPGARKSGGDDPLFETWSIGYYNPCGAWSIGQQWPESGAPATYEENGRLLARGMPFPEGTVVVKLLNTTATEKDVPYMKGSTNWQANGHKQTGPRTYATCEREVREVHLVQMDLAVVDTRSPTRWVYSTLVYDGTLPGATIWDRMRPLGVQWGNDPQTFPAVPLANSKPLSQSVAAPVNIHEHYGCFKRLAGDVDQSNSSCTSCHMGAYAAAPGVEIKPGENVPPIFKFDGICDTYNATNASYFANYAYPSPFPGSSGDVAAAIPLDTSLQLQVAFAQYAYFKNSDPKVVPKSTCPPAR
ncbi:hypothetical protein WMF11_46385 [Sorangium sp. So ce295]|uniref:hypothetical protein n=1 Tax=Sorangium sp. So ce295 TaxID=3133295 RepID=UPI003F5EFCEB